MTASPRGSGGWHRDEEKQGHPRIIFDDPGFFCLSQVKPRIDAAGADEPWWRRSDAAGGTASWVASTARQRGSEPGCHVRKVEQRYCLPTMPLPRSPVFLDQTTTCQIAEPLIPMGPDNAGSACWQPTVESSFFRNRHGHGSPEKQRLHPRRYRLDRVTASCAARRCRACSFQLLGSDAPWPRPSRYRWRGGQHPDLAKYTC